VCPSANKGMAMTKLSNVKNLKIKKIIKNKIITKIKLGFEPVTEKLRLKIVP
jgi:hypothetical protein